MSQFSFDVSIEEFEAKVIEPKALGQPEECPGPLFMPAFDDIRATAAGVWPDFEL